MIKFYVQTLIGLSTGACSAICQNIINQNLMLKGVNYIIICREAGRWEFRKEREVEERGGGEEENRKEEGKEV